MIGTVIGIISIVLAYLAYRSQSVQSFKRVHYSGFMTPLIWLDTPATEALAVRLDGEDLINPFLCVVSIENTGRAPIVPSDYSGPLRIRTRDKAIFRGGCLAVNRPSIVEDLDSLKVEVQGRELRMAPILLNPRDKLTFFYVADVIPESEQLEVAARIAGVEEIAEILKLHAGTHAVLTRMLMRITPKRADDEAFEVGLVVETVILPILLDPGERLSRQLEVMVGRRGVRNAHVASIVVSNYGEQTIRLDSQHLITVDFQDSPVFKIAARNNFGPLGNAEWGSYISKQDSRISIKVPELGPSDHFAVDAIISGSCPDVEVRARSLYPQSAHIVRLEASSLVEQNLADAGSRMLLSNQRLHVAWRKLEKKHKWAAKMSKRGSNTSASR